MSHEPDLSRVLEDMADRARTERLPDPPTLRRAAERRHRRRLAIATASVAALVIVPLTATVEHLNQSAPPVSPSGFDCPAPVHGPKRADWSGDKLHKPGWVQTFPAVPPHRTVEFTSVAANQTGYLVDGRTYAGKPGPTFHDNQDKLWFSTDGRTWTTLHRPSVGNALLALDGKFYSIGYAKDGSPALWATTNGRDWRETTIVHNPQRLDVWEGKLLYLNRLACADGKLVAYGADHGTFAGWASTDGSHWYRLDRNGSVLSGLSRYDEPSLAGDGPAGTVAIPPWGDGWAPARIWFHRS